jgi:hypothetical protein
MLPGEGSTVNHHPSERDTMGVAALISWVVTAFGGLYLLVIWLIENEASERGATATRLPLPVVSGHALLAVAGFGLWIFYLLIDRDVLAWGTVAILAVVTVLGLTMVSRWIRVYRAPVPTGGSAMVDVLAVPAERNFPLLVVLGHGLLGVTTIVLVVLTTLGVGES